MSRLAAGDPTASPAPSRPSAPFPLPFQLRPPFPIPIRPRPWEPRRILDPGSDLVLQWNRVFLVSCLVALSLDPLYFYILQVRGPACMAIDLNLAIVVTFFRTIADLFYLAHMVLKFRIAFIAPSSRVFGKGELVKDPKQIARRYLRSDFVIDLAAMFPIPQIIVWFVIPAVSGSTAHTNNTLSLLVLIQYVPRLFLIFPLNARIVKATGVVARTAWTGAVYNLLLYMLASHVLGALWYLLSMERQNYCWVQECLKENTTMPGPFCNPAFLDCKSLEMPERNIWLNATQLLSNCDAANRDTTFQFGMFADALTDNFISSTFVEKYLYCLWWGLRNLSSYGQDLETTTYVGETSFCILISIVGLVLFSHLIGNMQGYIHYITSLYILMATINLDVYFILMNCLIFIFLKQYLQSMTVRVEEWRVKRRDTEEWMRHRQLPEDLQERVRRFEQYKWLATRGVDEESILRSLPMDLRRDIQRHLCLGLVRRVPFFSQMDDQLLDAICERLVSSLSTPGTYIVQEGDPVNEMLFIIRGQLESSTTNGGRSGFFNSITLRPGDFCGEELLTWALVPNPSVNFPSSTRTVRALTEVEAFALRAEELKFVANQFKRLHSKKLQHAFRYYSHQWRTWGACFIQAAWRRHKKRELAKELAKQERLYYSQMMTMHGLEQYVDDEEEHVPLISDYDEEGANDSTSVNANNYQHFGATILASRFAKNTKRGAQRKVVAPSASSLKMPKLMKPEEPDFSKDSEDDI